MVPSLEMTLQQDNYTFIPLSLIQNVTSFMDPANTISEDPSTVKINASNVANLGQNLESLNATDSQELLGKFMSNVNENDGELDLTTSRGSLIIRNSKPNPPTFTDKGFTELLKILGHLWGDPNKVKLDHREVPRPGVTDSYYQVGIQHFELDEQIHKMTVTVNSTPTVFVSGPRNVPVYPWNIEESQDGINTVFSSNETDCISQLVEASHWIYLYGVGFLIIIALLLNCVSLVVFQSKPLRNLSFSVYLSALSITDTVALIGHVPRKWLNILYLSLGWGTGVTFYDSSTVACKALTFISYGFRFLSSWLLVGLACERLAVSTNPYKPSKLRTMKSARHAIIYCVIASLIFNSHVLFTWKSVPIPGSFDGARSCIPMAPSDFISVALTVTTILTIVGLPFLILAIVTIFTIRNFGSWGMRPRRLSPRAICRALLEKQATSMVVVISVMFCILSVPYTISWIVLLVQHFTSAFTPMCQYVQISAARDISEVGFMFTYALKFLICIFTGRNVLNTK